MSEPTLSGGGGSKYIGWIDKDETKARRLREAAPSPRRREEARLEIAGAEMPTDLYDSLAPFYHLLFEDWEASIERQAAALDALIRSRWGRAELPVLDVAAGIGTQSLGLAALGYRVRASDRSRGAVARARTEAAHRQLCLPVCVADLTTLPYRAESAGLVLAADNSLPHLLTDAALRLALHECFRCLRPGGGLLVTVRDYGSPPLTGTIERKPYGWRRWGREEFFVSQEWRWDGPCYDFRITASRGADGPAVHEFAGRYYAISVSALEALCREVGFHDVQREDAAFYQPVILATRPAAR
jgi:SAM-dependent methyltransferase